MESDSSQVDVASYMAMTGVGRERIVGQRGKPQVGPDPRWRAEQAEDNGNGVAGEPPPTQ